MFALVGTALAVAETPAGVAPLRAYPKNPFPCGCYPFLG